MADNIDHTLIEHLKAIRANLARHDEKLDELLARVGMLERSMSRVHVEYADSQEFGYRQQAAIDRLSGRVERIERRLELND